MPQHHLNVSPAAVSSSAAGPAAQIDLGNFKEFPEEEFTLMMWLRVEARSSGRSSSLAGACDMSLQHLHAQPYRLRSVCFDAERA